MNTPFIFGKTVSGEAFTDRENETAKLVSNFQYGVNTFIVSPRRWGKTSLVKKVKGLAESEKLKIVYVDVQQCRCKEDFCERFASAVLSQTATKVNEWLENAKTFLGRFSFGINASPDPTNEMSLKINLSPKERSLEDLLQLPEKIANRKGFRVVICIDEFQQIGSYPETMQFQTELRSVWQHHELTSYCLFGSRKHMMEALFDDVSKPFYKFGDIIYLQRIPTEYWVKYITGKFQIAEKIITKKQAAWIVAQVDGHSSYVQQLSWYVFQRTETKVTESILTDALRELIAQCSDLFESKTENLTAYQMNFLKAISNGVTSGFSSTKVIQEYRLGSSANVSIIKKALIEKDLIVKEDEKLKLADPVLGLWLQHENA